MSNLAEQDKLVLLSMYGTTDPVVADLARRIAVLENVVLPEDEPCDFTETKVCRYPDGCLCKPEEE